MLKPRFRLPGPALIISMITLTIVLGGTAFAANSVATAKHKHKDAKADTKLVKKLAPKLNVKHAKTANSATTAANATHATSADSATTATHATSADSATNATNATNATHATSATSATTATSATNATNANTVGGYAPSGLTRVALMSTSNTTALSISEQTYGGTLSITAPAAGFVLVNGSYTLLNSGCTAGCDALGRIRHIQDSTYSKTGELDVTNNVYSQGSMSYVFPVNAGVNTFDLRLSRFNGTTGAIDGWFGEMNAIYSPFGSTGGSTLTSHPSVAKTPVK